MTNLPLIFLPKFGVNDVNFVLYLVLFEVGKQFLIRPNAKFL